jgi:uncharacterized OB-fold protein
MTEPGILVSRCGECTLRYLPRAGPCPRCGASRPLPLSIPPYGVVLAATELTSPAQGWPTPHRIALVELAESVRVLAVVESELPVIGAPVEILHEGETYRARAPGSLSP